MYLLALSSEFYQGFWQGVFELLALAIVGYFINVLYASYTSRSRKKQEIIDELDRFVTNLWKPRKIYYLLQEDKLNFLNVLESEETRKLQKHRLLAKAFDDLLESIAQFRAVQIKIVTFFGLHVELLAHFMTIWFYLKEVRRRMERGETLLFGSPRTIDKNIPKLGEDDLYVLIDRFRFLIASTPKAKMPPLHISPDPALAKQVQDRASEIYRAFFGDLPEKRESLQEEVLSYNKVEGSSAVQSPK